MTDQHDSGKHGLEWNKLFAAVLVAGIVALSAAFVSRELTDVEVPEKAVLDIDTSALEAAAAGAPAGPVGPEPILAMLEKADIKRGESLSKACTACHSFDKGGANHVGPNQWDLVGGPKAHRDDFAYSDALKALHGKGEKWSYTELNHFIYKPMAAVPGTKMNYLGLKKPEDRAALIAYLRTLSDSPAPMPSNEEIQAEQTAYQAAQPKSAAAPAAPAADAKDAAAATGTGATPSVDPTSSAKPLENSAPVQAPSKAGQSAIPATEHAVPPAATK